MTKQEIEDAITLYRQALAMVFSWSIAKATKINYFEPRYLDGVRFWVNQVFYLQSGALVTSPTGWKSYTPAEFEAETKKLFNQAKETELRMAGEK